MFATILSLILFAIFMTGSPGPGNLLMMAGGASLNFKKCYLFLIGLVTGKTLVNILIFFGFGALVINNNVIFEFLKYLSSIFILFFALSSLKLNEAKSAVYKFNFKNGFLIHPLSPKTWSMIILAQTQLINLNLNQIQRSLIIWIIFTIGQILFHSLWCIAGAILGKTIENNLIISRLILLVTILFVFWFLVFG
tara:strand:- start:1120 stop:1701 length:582 start_codon:yes stop_codon:yes gene_type:complete